ncbi:MAG: DUF1552 domain-containing protein [Myxococcota bacterium]
MTHGNSRRQFLRSAAGFTLGLPFLRSAAGAQPTAAPKRLITLYMPNNETEGFMPTGSGRSFSLVGSYLEAFEPYKDRLLLLHNLRGKHGHQNGHCENLTGFGGNTDFSARGGPSICQLIAARQQGEVAVPFLGMGLLSARRSSSNSGTSAWSADGLPIPLDYEPRVAFERVFGPIGGTPTTPDDAERRRNLQRSLLDELMEDYRALDSQLGVEDRRLLDAHLSLLRDEERRLQSNVLEIGCETELSPPPESDTPDWSSGDKLEKLEHFIRITARAVACDATRVATLFFGMAQSGGLVSQAGVNEDFHDIAHRAVPNAAALHFQVRAFDAAQVATLIQALDAIPEGDGTVLDHSIVAWLPELGLWESTRSGNSHSRSNVPALLIGGGGGFLDTGRVVDLQQAAYPRLLLTLVHAMGLTDVTRVGDGGDAILSELIR